MDPTASTLEFRLNGRPVSFEGLPAQTSLLDLLRSQGCTGAKEGCAEGECGACAVVLVRDTVNGPAYRAMNSCLMFAPMVAGQEILNGRRIEPGRPVVRSARGDGGRRRAVRNAATARRAS
ncbi:MAG: 2Fe-2S iron-sulfur cluster-binding protein [Acidobacteriota bacterium]